jgi:3-deoxy-D-manno-octulosonic-acid transferase
LLVYRLLSFAALAAYAPYALVRSLLGRRKIGNLRGRLGREPYPDLSGGVWVHAVSVGEVGVARNLLGELARRDPSRRLGLSVTTAAGSEMARRVVGSVSVPVPVFAFPLDLAGPVERSLAGVRPGLVLLTETELWPLFLERAARRGIAVALVNGRLSERSFSRYRLVAGPFSRILAQVSLFAMQSEEDARRAVTLGAPPDRVRVTGNLKYDLPVAAPFADAARLRAAAAGRPVFVAGSTGEDEEGPVLEAWSSIPEAERPLLAIAPRRPERFEPVAAMLRQRGFGVVRRSGDAAPPANPGGTVYLLDSIGELAALYRESPLAFVGGSLVPPGGGHNPIEAWAAGASVIVGPHTHNFRDIVSDGSRADILERVDGPAELAAAIRRCLADTDELTRRSAAARRAVEANRGAVARTADLVLPLLRDVRRAG